MEMANGTVQALISTSQNTDKREISRSLADGNSRPESSEHSLTPDDPAMGTLGKKIRVERRNV
jgi:hypothetical protein